MRSLCISLAITAGLLIGCGRREPESTPAPYRTRDPATSGVALPANVVEVTWEWISMTTPVERFTVGAPERYTIRFERDGRAALRADCNRGGTSYSTGADKHIKFQPIALTRMMCPAGSLGDRFARDVGRASSYFIKDDDFYLELPVDSGTLRFRRQWNVKGRSAWP